jgi:hypothetical protein
MDIKIPIFQDFSLSISDCSSDSDVYPTERLQKGLLLRCRDLDMAEEAVGFGVPVLKRGLQAYFPGDVELGVRRTGTTQMVSAIYNINLVEKIGRPGKDSVDNKLIYGIKNILAAVIRQFRPARGIMTSLSSSVRKLFNLKTSYERVQTSTLVKITYVIDEQKGVLDIEVDFDDLSRLGFTEAIIMNEQGAHIFDQYFDSSGVKLSGEQIGLWDEVTADEAGFSSSAHGLAFSLNRLPGTRLFRGRERIDSRLAWSGFGYSIPASVRSFKCTVRIGMLQ